ncbi:asparagine synthase-related protein [Riemerella anatipestifer]|uniref:asparagine synthase-related protein n=1 Tax=Riemerella anatipestifer TaxID=34085 RepID=UPI002A8F6B0C|nr:asparagine synthase-related protein [Riemerella anatipestifer]
MSNKFKYYNHLGFHNPYYIKGKEGKFVFADKISELLSNDIKLTLDYTALVSVLCTGFPFGDRTLVKGVNKTPWMAKPKENNQWEFYTVPRHGNITKPENEIADELYLRLYKEIEEYIENHDRIGVLLTGGMDSRVVAIVLNDILKEPRYNQKKVYTYTWGFKDSRDVVYAQKIAKIYGWSWKHLEVDVEQMKKNYCLTLEKGCEFTPIHLHAMSQVTDEELDCVLAGSFGDSVGRAEFSSVRLKNLSPIQDKIKNFSGILKQDLLNKAKKEIEKDFSDYYQKFPEEKEYQLYEQDQQIHYMRRMLNACMSVIDEEIPLYQAFSSPEVFGYMWLLSPECRTDMVYKVLIDKYGQELSSLPWARTGLPYLQTEGKGDQLKKRHHDYQKMIRNFLLDDIEKTITNYQSITKRIFNYNALLNLLNNVRNHPIKNSYIYEEKLFWVAAVIDFVSKHNIEVPFSENKNSCILEIKENLKYRVKQYIKKLR